MDDKLILHDIAIGISCGSKTFYEIVSDGSLTQIMSREIGADPAIRHAPCFDKISITIYIVYLATITRRSKGPGIGTISILRSFDGPK